MHLTLLQNSLKLSLFGKTIKEFEVIGVRHVCIIFKTDMFLKEGISIQELVIVSMVLFGFFVKGIVVGVK